MDLINTFREAWPSELWRNCHLVVAVSGGADSVALLSMVATVHQQTSGAGRILAAHFNHRLRGSDSDEDAAWVERLAGQLGLPSAIGQATGPDSLASEEQARSARYAYLTKTAEEFGARYVATAHTADDQVETVLMRVLRGSGIDGLSGTPKSRPLSDAVTLVRPLLDVRRSQIEDYLASLEQEYRTDASNLKSHYTRNWLRRNLLPLIRERLSGDPDQAILRLAQQAGEWRDAIDALANKLVEQSIEFVGDTFQLDATELYHEPAIIVQQACRIAWRRMGWAEQSMGMREWRKLAHAVQCGDAAAFELPGRVHVRRQGPTVVLARLQ